jgi:hypothetical protein
MRMAEWQNTYVATFRAVSCRAVSCRLKCVAFALICEADARRGLPSGFANLAISGLKVQSTQKVA